MRKEEILEAVYLQWQKGKGFTVQELCGYAGLSPKEGSRMVRSLVRQGCLEPVEEDGKLKLTDVGKAAAIESLTRCQYLTEFLQLTCGVAKEQARENACRMEHALDEAVLSGVREFLKYGDTCDRMVRNLNLHSMYEKGSYTFYMGIYCMEQRYPRILAEEFYNFSESVRLEVEQAHSSFYLQEKEKESVPALWYQEASGWKRAQRTPWGFRIPAEIFTFTLSSKFPVTEGDGVIAFSQGNDLPGEESCRELNVHIW